MKSASEQRAKHDKAQRGEREREIEEKGKLKTETRNEGDNDARSER